jgi:hypothetical protein
MDEIETAGQPDMNQVLGGMTPVLNTLSAWRIPKMESYWVGVQLNLLFSVLKF